MPERLKQLRHDIQDYLDEEIRSKNNEDRSERENLILNAGQVFLDLLNRQSHALSERERQTDRKLNEMLNLYREISAYNGMGK